MADKPPPPSPKNPRYWAYALIPLAFLVLVAALLLGGEAVQETTDSGMDDGVEEAVE
ncbi:hypothetical protein [Wenxinia marina]|uniref:Uncharacterized protein n=1 Tax=Wenxinia marina DSM 24838 TaxID=1123501 RepID=A0A0D0NRS7_9RHOB|nr:hypothetical protein [Wenxinia marina]KIQ70945.1 hypothetical protein Wenmar_00320 [Wenxinia marina DSM 24838]GGL56076.1 hypothetical protein GCM10011392_08140 [Wenxinia marina]